MVLVDNVIHTSPPHQTTKTTSHHFQPTPSLIFFNLSILQTLTKNGTKPSKHTTRNPKSRRSIPHPHSHFHITHTFTPTSLHFPTQNPPNPQNCQNPKPIVFNSQPLPQYFLKSHQTLIQIHHLCKPTSKSTFFKPPSPF